MNKLDHIILTTAIISIIAVTINSFYLETKGVSESSILGGTEPSKIETSLTGTTLASDSAESYITANGQELRITKLTNSYSNPKNVRESIDFGGREIEYNATIAPNSAWSYASIHGFLIIPDGEVNRYFTSYYPLGDDLKISLIPNSTKTIEVYSSKRPSIIVVDKSIEWNYDYLAGKLSIKSKDYITSMSLYFIDFDLNSTVFIENTERIEILARELAKMNTRLNELHNISNEKNIPVEDLNVRIDNISQVIYDKLSVKRSLDNLSHEMDSNLSLATAYVDNANSEYYVYLVNISNNNKTYSEMSNRMSANVLLEPSTAAIIIIISAVVLVLLVDIFFFEMKGVRHEKIHEKGHNA